ncbi:MAG: hypothetical protein HC869_14930 [Rhodospirillales bacterium]|nr:hypothetical protein [Rhodospirillales bacterium]
MIAEKRATFSCSVGLRRPLSCVWPETDHDAHPGRLVLWVGDKPAHQSRPKPWPLTDRGRVSLFDPFPVGVDQRGRPVTLTLMFASMLIGAVPRMGKSFSLRLILLAAALDHTAELHVFDLKGGVDHRPLAMVAHRYRSGDDEEDLAYVRDDLRDLKTEMTRRYKVLRGLPETVCPEGKVTPQLAADRTLGLHPIVVALDECQVLFEHPVFGADAVEVCTDLVKRGPAVGITMVLATQRPDAKSIPTPISTSAVLRFCLKVMSQTSNDMVLGTSMYKAGVRATMFAFSDKGTGYLLGEGSDPQIVRTAYLDAVTAKTIAARARSYRVAAGTLTGHAAGPTAAGTVSGWWGGAWQCNIDGRPARMKWVTVDDSQTNCDGDSCTTTSGARWKGSFSDNGSSWVPLTNPRRGQRGGLYFNYADGNRWYLATPSGSQTRGWTTWNGQRYSLSCWR